MLQILDKLSLAFGHMARLLTLGVFFLITALVAASTFALLISAPFEYSYGQDDLALSDLIVLSLLALVSWRYFQRGRQSQTGFWPLIKRLTFTVTFVTLLLLSALGFLASIASLEPEIASEPLAGGADDLILYGVFCIFIIAIYGATPLPALSKQAEMNHNGAATHQYNESHSNHEQVEPPILNPSTENQR